MVRMLEMRRTEMDRVDLLKSGSVTKGHCYDLYHNWKLVSERANRSEAIDAARELAQSLRASLTITV